MGQIGVASEWEGDRVNMVTPTNRFNFFRETQTEKYKLGLFASPLPQAIKRVNYISTANIKGWIDSLCIGTQLELDGAHAIAFWRDSGAVMTRKSRLKFILRFLSLPRAHSRAPAASCCNTSPLFCSLYENSIRILFGAYVDSQLNKLLFKWHPTTTKKWCGEASKYVKFVDDIMMVGIFPSNHGLSMHSLFKRWSQLKERMELSMKTTGDSTHRFN